MISYVNFKMQPDTLPNINLLIGGLKQSPDLTVYDINDLVKNFELPREIKYGLLLGIANFFNSDGSSDKDKSIQSLLELLEQLKDKNIVSKAPIIPEEVKRRKIFSCIDINKEYDGNTAFKLENISFDLFEGEITAVVGENGNGKSTVCKIVAGLLKEDSGTLRYPIFQTDPEKLNWLSLKEKIIFLPQELQKTNGSIEENLIFEGRMAGISVEQIEDVTQFYIQRLGLHNYRYATWENLSGGYRLRFKLALCLIKQPRLLILDEPLGNLDIKAQAELLYDLRQLCNSRVNPLTLIITSQHIDEIEHIADNILYIENGKALLNCKISEIGEDGESCFELRSPSINSTILFELFKPMGLVRTYMTNIGQAMLFEKKISFYDVSKTLYKSNIPISYLREITHSSKKVFYFGT